MANGANVGSSGVGFIGRSRGFLADSVAELKKVHAPSRAETLSLTWRVLIMVAVFSVLLGLIDLGMGKLMKWLITA